jgi:hypothetical protein
VERNGRTEAETDLKKKQKNRKNNFFKKYHENIPDLNFIVVSNEIFMLHL